jgi:hypothetical protein
MNSSAPATEMEREGVIKYRLDFRAGPAPEFKKISDLNAWRSLLHRLRLIGQDPERYGGLAYGNVSKRLPKAQYGARAFIVSGTQTGDLEMLDAGHYCIVRDCSPGENWLKAEGPIRPSSEAMTHAALYAANARINAVMHVHCPEIWCNAVRLGIPTIDADIAFGTPEMALAVRSLLSDDSRMHPSLFAMMGHTDGIVAFGPSAASAGLVLIRWLARNC